MITPDLQGPGMKLEVIDLQAGKAKAIMHASGAPERLTRCSWTANTRLVCTIFAISDSTGMRLSFTRLIALNSDGTDLKILSRRTNSRSLHVMQSGGGIVDLHGDGSDGSTLMTSQFVPEETIGTHLASTSQGLGVEAVNTVSLRRRLVEPAKPDAVEYHSDGHGSVRVMGRRTTSPAGYTGDRVLYSYRSKNDREWRALSTVTYESGASSGFDPYAVDRDLDVAYGFERKDGRSALYRVALDGSLKKELVYARDDVDVDELVRIGRQRRVVGVAYATERRHAEFFDPELARLRQSLGRALGGERNLSFIDATADETKLLVFAGSDVDPGRYYIYDKASKRLELLLPVRSPLDRTPLATVKPITYRAADGTAIPGYLTLPPGSSERDLPAIVMPHGGPGARDEWGFDWLAQFFAHRGFAVLQPNFRGSAGYGEAWFQKNGFQSWRTAVSDVNDAGRHLVAAGIARPGKLAIVGWSYGGYAALQSAVLDPTLFKGIVAIAPVTDLDALREESRGYTNFNLVDRFIGRGPEVRAGSPAQNATAITAPVLMFHGDLDLNVGVRQSRIMKDRLSGAGKDVSLIEFKGLDHQLDDSAARTRMLETSDSFLRKALGL
jgi:dipeptidyl aminopeptidase/acylaminoacyl peptidase